MYRIPTTVLCKSQPFPYSELYGEKVQIGFHTLRKCTNVTLIESIAYKTVICQTIPEVFNVLLVNLNKKIQKYLYDTIVLNKMTPAMYSIWSETKICCSGLDRNIRLLCVVDCYSISFTSQRPITSLGADANTSLWGNFTHCHDVKTREKATCEDQSSSNVFATSDDILQLSRCCILYIWQVWCCRHVYQSTHTIKQLYMYTVFTVTCTVRMCFHVACVWWLSSKCTTVHYSSGGFSPSVVCRVGLCWTVQGQSNKSPGYGRQDCGRWMMDLSARVHNGGTGEHGGEGQHSALSP